MVSVRAIGNPKFDYKAIEQAILKEKDRKGEDIVKLLEKTVKTWTDRINTPRFSAKVRDRGKDVVIEVTITGTQLALDKWKWLDEGTKRHLIPLTPTPGVTLIFRYPGFVAKTKTGVLDSFDGQEADGPIQKRQQVKHPGTEARGWVLEARKVMEKGFGKRVSIILKGVVEDN